MVVDAISPMTTCERTKRDPIRKKDFPLTIRSTDHADPLCKKYKVKLHESVCVSAQSRVANLFCKDETWLTLINVELNILQGHPAQLMSADCYLNNFNCVVV